MKKKVFSLMMMLVLAFMGIARADELTVNDGTTTNSYVPVYGFYADAYLKCEFVQPAADLAAMNGGNINGMTFYASQESVSWGAANFQVFLTEVADASISAFAGPGTLVYEGALSISGGLMNVAFTTPYHYNGGNLLVGVYNTVIGSYVSSSWYGVSVDGASVQGYSYSSLDAVSPTQRNFLPKVTFDYTAGGGAVSGDITVYDGTATNSYVPVYGLYTDAYLKCEMVYPSTELAAMANTNISSMKFYLSTPASASWGSANFQVFMAEVADATISTFAGPGTMVYEGALDGTQAEMEITFTTPYHYNGGNLLVGVYNTVIGTYKSCYFYGETVTGASVQGYSYSDLSSVSPTQRNFLPKTTFSYVGAGGGGVVGDQLFALQDGEVVETIDFGSRPNGCWMEPFTFQLRNDGPATTVSNLDFTPTDYFTVVAPELPVQMANGEVIDVEVTTGETNATAWQMVAIYGLGRTARVWDVIADPYDPAIPDVVEMAHNFGTVNDGFSYSGIPSQITPTVLHNDYTLPFPEIPEGEDAVYKFTVATDMIINANVDETALNGKVALYTEDFNGEAGPMADNNYTGIQVGAGGAAGGAFQAMIGDETSTSTSTYFPFHTLWNYSLAENLYLASELSEAGVTTAPMTSLSWYVSSMSCTTPQNNISIYMGNVSDTELTSTSHSIAGMTLVYTGSNILPTAGQWNEFVFNQGNFAWDGQSNVVILCVRNNGTYQGSISWQTHNPGFTAMCYHYSDTNGGYDVTVPNTGMYTSATNRANIIMKGGNRENTRDVITQGFEDGLGDWTMVDCHASTGVSTSASAIHTGSNGFAFHWSTTPPQYLISPLLNGDSGVGLSFFYEQNSTYYDETFQVGYSTTSNSASAFTFGPEITATNSWAEYTNSFPAGTKYIAIKCTSNDQYYLYIDDITITTAGGGVTPPPTPGLAGMSAGPVITNLPIAPGTYYLVASAQQADYTVNINIDNMPCPAIDAEGFAFNPTPADDENEVEPASVTLRWNVPAYATGYRVIFGTSYFPEPGHPQTIMYPEDGSFTDHVLANSFTVRNLYNNNHYFWRVEFNNDACPQGVSSPVWGFTTHLNIPQNLTAVDYTVFDDEQIVLNWNAVVDRTYRYYNVYRDGVLVGSTQMNNINNTTYTDGPLAYNMSGYTYYVTAMYDEGESAPSDPVTVKVAGYGDVNGHVYEQDGTTGIAGATVTMVGLDEFNVNHTYTFTTNNQGYYSGHIYAGTYNGQAAKDGYQTMTEPVQGNPVVLTYNNTTSPVDYILDENFDPVCQVIAEYYPDSLDPNSPYVKVYWGCGLPGSEIIEDFETGDFSQFDWQVDPTYPWTITTQNPYEGDYCMKSGGAGVANVVSNMTVTVNIPADGLMSFFGKISCESNWDYGYFYIDGVQKGNYTGAGNWAERTFDITAGDHTFMWQYTKDGSVNSNDDCFYVDYITFYKQPAPPVPGMTYDFEDSSMQGWTSVDADGDGYGWYVASEIMSTGYGHNGSNDCVLSQSYNNSVGVLYPDNYLVSPQVQLGGVLRFYACAQDASYAAEHFGVAVSTTNTQPSSFTMLNEWTMTAKSVGETGKPVKGSRSGREQGNWYEYTVDLSAYSGNGYVAIRHFNCSDMFYLDVDDITIGEPGKSIARNDRSLEHYKIYRTDCYNDGPYTTENTTLLATNWPGDTIYIDVEWHDLLPGMYKWGVSCVYVGNRGELVESPINWTAPVAVNNNTRDMVTCDFESGLPAGWTVIDGNNDGLTWTLTSAIPTTWTYYASLTLDWYHGGSNAICSGSYINGYGAVTPDEYLVSPQVTLGAGSSIEFWVAATDESYPADHFGVFVSDNGTSNWTSVQEWTLTAKKSGETGGRASRDGGGLRIGTWYNYNVDLSAYAGQKYIAFRHFNCYDQYIMCLDDITINTSGSTPPTPPTPPTPGQGGTQVVTFEDGQLPAGWVNDASYPWTVGSPAYAGYNGTYCMMSGNSGISSSTSAMEATVTFVENGSVSFLGGCWGEGTSTIWDKCQFFIDGNEQFSYGALQSWDTYSFNVTAGTHTFRWSYTKDSSVNPTGDAFFVDDITFNGVAGAGGNGLQEPRESEIVWSNCLDKDMYLTVADVNVLLNSADSPEGTVVTFTNYNEAEQLAYPIDPIVLDESGFYAFESFRRGAYKVTVELEGYEPIVDSINYIDYPNNLLTEMHLRYVMTEILYGVGDVYVSRTGWAMWGDSNINPNPNPGPGGNASTFDVDFEGGMPEGWNVIDANGDGYTWCLTSNIPSTWSYYAGMSLDWYHNGTNAICSGSYINGVGALNPDEYLVSPQVTLAAGSQLSFWAAATDASYPADHFGVFVSDNGTSDWTAVQEWTLSGKGGAKAGDRASRDGEGLRIGTWYNYTVDLSAYAGQKYIAFRHFNCYDQYIMCLDDIALTSGAKDGDRHFEYYKVMCTSIDGVPIYNHNTVYPFCQLTTVDPNSGLPMLIEGEHYLVKVAAMYSTGMSEWSTPVEWEYEPCDHWGPVDEVAVNTTNQGNHIQWVFEHGYNPYDPGTGPVPPTPGEGDWYYYDNGVNVDAVGLTAGGSFYWGVMFPAGSYTGNMVTKVSMYDYEAHTGNILVYQGGSTAPATLVGQQAYTCTGSNAFVEWTLDNPAVIDPSQNLWIVMNNNNGQYVASACDDTGNPNGRWVSIDGTAWEDIADAGLPYTWMLRAYVASGAKGEPQILSYNGKSSNGGTLAISGNGPRVKVENVNFAMMSENALELNIASIANFDARVYFLCNLVNDSRFSVINSEEDGKFIVSANDNIDLKDSFVDFIERTMKGFSLMDKYAAADFAIANKGMLPMSFTNSMMMDIYAKSRDNSHCADAYPFCTDEGMYEFPAGVNAGTGESGPDYDCLYTTPNPAWYYMKMADPGDMDIYMYSTPSVDIDFCCWGPFDDPTSPCPNGLTSDKVVSCSYSAQPTEHCMIPASAQTGQYYILVITNYSNQACNINFSKVGGSGTTDCGIIPPTNVDLIGFLITQDGEYLAIVGPDEREYTDIDEYGDHEYCVRPIYPGEMTLPDHNYGWSMGCPVCNHPGGGFLCEPGDPIHSEDLPETDQIRVWWGVEPQPPMEEWLYYDDGTYATSIGVNGGTIYWASMFPAAAIAPYAGTNLTKVALYENSYNTDQVTVSIYLGGASAPATLVSTMNYTPAGADDFHEVTLTTPVAIDGTQNLWIVFSEYGTYPANACADTGDANNRWISLDGSDWMDVASAGVPGYGWMIRGFVTNQAKGTVENIALEPVKPAMVETTGLTLGHTAEVSIPAPMAFMNRSEIVTYNVYRSENETSGYDLIGTVPAVAGQTLYEYFDSPEPGTYYYQVTALYDDGCESEPAPNALDPTINYVPGHCDGLNENSDNVALYPNPTNGNVTIEANGMSRITVVSVLGQVVYDTELNADQFTLNMGQFNAGMYMVRVYTEEGVTVKRVTVMQ